VRAALGLGSNLGDRRAHLDRAIEGLRARADVEVVAVSRFRKTEPVGGPAGQPRYLNAVVLVETDLEPAALLAVAAELERAAGRVRTERWGPRTLDVDVLLVGDRRVDAPGLTIPHPRLRERRFVLEPLAELAPDWVVPGGNETVEELFEGLSQRR
jgi:2-amino-4-hydroxy-6-hydroxymethyldihydropteridine diphosphokinase